MQHGSQYAHVSTTDDGTLVHNFLKFYVPVLNKITVILIITNINITNINYY